MKSAKHALAGLVTSVHVESVRRVEVLQVVCRSGGLLHLRGHGCAFSECVQVDEASLLDRPQGGDDVLRNRTELGRQLHATLVPRHGRRVPGEIATLDIADPAAVKGRGSG